MVKGVHRANSALGERTPLLLTVTTVLCIGRQQNSTATTTCQTDLMHAWLLFEHMKLSQEAKQQRLCAHDQQQHSRHAYPCRRACCHPFNLRSAETPYHWLVGTARPLMARSGRPQ